MTDYSLHDELTRKTLETVEALALRQEQGVITNRQFHIAMQAVWDCTSGLVDQMREVWTDLVEMKLELERENWTVSNGKQVFLIARNKVITTVTDCLTMVEGSLKAHETEVDAVEHVRKLLNAFRSKGFKVL